MRHKQAGESVQTRVPAPARAPRDKPDTDGAATHNLPHDRRNGLSRRAPGNRPRRPKAKDAAFRKHIVPDPWWFMSIAIGVGLIICTALTGTFPSLAIFSFNTCAIAIALLSRRVAKLERASRTASKWLMPFGWLTVLLPVGLFAASLISWHAHAGLGWPWIVAGILTMNTLSFALLTDRPAQQIACLLTSWGVAAFIVGTPSAFGAWLLGSFTTALIGHYKAKTYNSRQLERQARERARNRAEDILRDYEETGQGWFWETDRRGLLTYVSPSIAKVTQRPETEILGRHFTELFDLGEDNRDGERTLAFHLSARSSFQELGVRAATPGEERWWSISGRPAYDNFHNFVGFRGSGTDLTEKKRSEENVTRLAQYDSLTGLANRFQTHQTLDKILSAPQERQRECAVFMLDLDRFKNVNDTLGHPAGDELLVQVARRLERTVGQAGRVGRLGGDEFKVIFAGHTERPELEKRAQEIIHALSQPYSIDGQRVVIGASIGIAMAPDNGSDSETIVRNSDLALYAAKDAGRGCYHFYSNDLQSAAEERNQLEQDLRDAIAAGNLELHFQPVIRTQDENVAGFEALVRWNHPVRGWLSPSKFIPIAEETGLIIAIGEWAIRTVCDQLAKWPDHIRCAVNVSPLQFANPQLSLIVTNAVARARIDPSRLELEITESVFLDDDESTEAMFSALHRIGVRLALDDFGTGYASLGYLKKAPFNKIKIDQSFVRGATDPGSRNGALIASITSLARSLGMETTAEGVETLDELELVCSLGCSHVQGYIYSKALTSEEATQRLGNSELMVPRGPKSARAARQAMLRKVVLENKGQFYNGKIRNLAPGGALIEGLWNVPPGTKFNIALSRSVTVAAVAIWGEDNRMGVQFEQQLNLGELGSTTAPEIDQATKLQSSKRKSA